MRRGYSSTDGIDPVAGTLLGGLFFIAFMKDPGQVVTLHQRLGTTDALNEYIEHTGSSLFACPPRLAPGGTGGTGASTSHGGPARGARSTAQVLATAGWGTASSGSPARAARLPRGSTAPATTAPRMNTTAAHQKAVV